MPNPEFILFVSPQQPDDMMKEKAEKIFFVRGLMYEASVSVVNKVAMMPATLLECHEMRIFKDSASNGDEDLVPPRLPQGPPNPRRWCELIAMAMAVSHPFMFLIHPGVIRVSFHVGCLSTRF